MGVWQLPENSLFLKLPEDYGALAVACRKDRPTTTTKAHCSNSSLLLQLEDHLGCSKVQHQDDSAGKCHSYDVEDSGGFNGSDYQIYFVLPPLK